MKPLLTGNGTLEIRDGEVQIYLAKGEAVKPYVKILNDMLFNYSKDWMIV